MKKSAVLLLGFLLLLAAPSGAQHSIARQWNEKVLDAIRSDFARPTVHACNLFHASVAMCGAWGIRGWLPFDKLRVKWLNGYRCRLPAIR